MSQLIINNVAKTYPNGKQALKNANIEIESGEFVVFVGPSGCGKSTLLRMIAGLETITSGEIQLDGERINDLEPAERNIAMVFQNYALYPHMTVYKNLAYGLVNRKVSKQDINARVNKAAEMLQLSEYLQHKPQELSGGQRQRVAMGRAIVREPKLFLFDEPLSNLDAKLRNAMRLEIKSLQKRLGITAVYVTHDQVEAMTMADKIVILSAGKVEQIGTPHQIYHTPANLFVASFMGSPAMNLLKAERDGPNLSLGQTHIELDEIHDLAHQDLILGIRPECIRLESHSVENGDTVQMKTRVSAIEDLGAQRIVHFDLEGQPCLAITDASDLIEGMDYFATFAKSDVYLFDQASGDNIRSSQRASNAL